MTKNDESKQVPVDIEGHPLVELTDEQRAHKLELERNRLMKTANKYEFKSWTRENRQILISWAFDANYDTKLGEFKDIVNMYKLTHKYKEPLVLRTSPGLNKYLRYLDVLCPFCGQIHTFELPVTQRGRFENIYLPCEGSDTWMISFTDNTTVQPWEHDRLEEIKKWNGSWEGKLDG